MKLDCGRDNFVQVIILGSARLIRARIPKPHAHLLLNTMRLVGNKEETLGVSGGSGDDKLALITI